LRYLSPPSDPRDLLLVLMIPLIRLAGIDNPTIPTGCEQRTFNLTVQALLLYGL
jgi:hypothetical protein